MTLADLGAEVIKVEAPGRGDDTRSFGPPFVNGESTYFLAINRSKLGITLDFKQQRGMELLQRLIARSDVLFENFRPGTLARLGIGYEDLRLQRPRLIYCSISGYGQDGPRSSEPGYDVIIQGESGVMSVTGPEDGLPHKVGVSIADIVSGMYAVQGVLAALCERERTGRGQKVDIALLDCMVSTLTYQAGIHFATAETPRRMGNRHPSIDPYETFEASDGFFNLGAANDPQFRAVCSVIGLPELGDEPRFLTVSSRVENHAPLHEILDSSFRKERVAHWLRLLRQAGVPCGEVRDVAQALSEPQLKAREMILELEHPRAGRMRVTGSPIKLSEMEKPRATPPPMLGEHNRRVYCEILGLSDNEFEELQAAKVI